MCETQGLKILLADKQKHRVLNRNDRCRIIAPIEDRQFGDRSAGTFDAKHLFAPSRRALEDANTARLHDKQARAGLALAEYDLSPRVFGEDTRSSKKLNSRSDRPANSGTLASASSYWL